MNLRKKNKIVAEVSTSSMNDIMFFLMLFFLIMSTLLNPNVIKLTLPSSRHNQVIHQKEITISVTKDLQYFINNKPIAFNMLESQLTGMLLNDKNATVILRCDNSLSVQDLVNMLEIGNKLKVKMILATKSPDGTQK
ncbi:MAG TPA: biopolymer transporter ExbD [Bacteroidales bacterium]|jgi:biopolymer transport protein ExbD|nr:biopolymer transporter ExbD [Bacteroidales bacterium]